MSSNYETESGAVLKRRQIADHRIVFRAENIRRERTGVHARVGIACDDKMLAWSNFNVERDEDRVRLANSAYKVINGMATVYPQTVFKSDVDQFCAGLWDAQMADLMPVMMAGSEKPQPPEFVLYPFILREGGTLLFAPPGRGKSYTLMLMAVCADTGIDRLWSPARQTRSLFINLERGPKSVADRLGNINAALGLERFRPLATINARGRSLADVAAAAERYVKDHDIGCVFIDSISRAGAGNLNDNDAVNRAADTLNRMCQSWVALAHTPRADESHLYGSVMFEAAADVVVQLLSEQEEDGPLGIGLQITKQNDIGRVPLWTMALEFNEAGLDRVRHARPGEFPDVEAGRKLTMKEQVREHLKEIGSATPTQIAKDLGYDRSNVSTLLNSNQWFARIGKEGKQVLYGLAALP